LRSSDSRAEAGADLAASLAEHASVRRDVPLAPMMHLRIGGPASCFVEPFDEQGVAAAVQACRERDLPLRVLGGGSNVVVADAGVDGVVLHLANLNRMQREGTRVTVGAGVTMASLLRSTREAGLAGLEKLTGIPAEVGGAVAMNAGTRDGETFEHLVSLTVVRPDGALAVLGEQDFRPVYRNGRLDGAVVVQATFELTEDRPDAIFERFSTSLQKRNASQPVTQRSVGCVFQNPEGDAAGRLIQEAGCKELRRNGVQVSDKHANYFVNDAAGTAADFVALMDEVRRRVHGEFGVELRPEVKFWGFEDR